MSILNSNEQLFGSTPIKPRETWGVLDSSKIQSFQSCPRDFFYSHILGWRSEGNSIHLAFGSAWHEAMEIILTEGWELDIIQKAYYRFVEIIVEEMELSPEQLNSFHDAKNPANALRGLVEYTNLYKDNPADTLFVEIAGTAPIADDRVIHVKLDSVRRHNAGHSNSGQIYSLEHKTTGRRTSAWEEQWHYMFQIGAYNHFLHCIFGENERIDGVTINGSVWRKASRDFVRFPVSPSLDMWELWVNEANHWWDQIEWNMKLLHDTKESDRVMVAFPRNSASCSKFGCRHPHLCSVQANPLKRCHQPPLGYVQEFWDPRRRAEEAKYIVKPDGSRATMEANPVSPKNKPANDSEVSNNG